MLIFYIHSNDSNKNHPGLGSLGSHPPIPIQIQIRAAEYLNSMVRFRRRPISIISNLSAVFEFIGAYFCFADICRTRHQCMMRCDGVWMYCWWILCWKTTISGENCEKFVQKSVQLCASVDNCSSCVVFCAKKRIFHPLYRFFHSHFSVYGVNRVALRRLSTIAPVRFFLNFHPRSAASTPQRNCNQVPKVLFYHLLQFFC